MSGSFSQLSMLLIIYLFLALFGTEFDSNFSGLTTDRLLGQTLVPITQNCTYYDVYSGSSYSTPCRYDSEKDMYIKEESGILGLLDYALTGINFIMRIFTYPITVTLGDSHIIVKIIIGTLTALTYLALAVYLRGNQ